MKRPFLKQVASLLRILPRFVLPRVLLQRIDAESYSIRQFMEYAAQELEPSKLVLDAGAGSRPYSGLFSKQEYESTDFSDIFNTSYRDSHDFVCDLSNIPKPDNHYDAIICTQVLEHVEEPQKVIGEFYRVLKPGGRLFLTAPQGWGLHGEPYHFFNFAVYGLKSLFAKAGFEIVLITPRGGMFWYLGKRIRTLPTYIMRQYLSAKDQDGSSELKVDPLAVLLCPFYLVAVPFCCYLVPFLFFYLDKLDKKQGYTLGYSCYCRRQ